MTPKSNHKSNIHTHTYVEIVSLFTRLGFTAFGGPAAHISMLYDEAVTRKKWLEEHEFLDLLGATNLIPGPNSTEMAIHVGYRRGGWMGLLLAGICFIVPAMLLVLIISWLYSRYNTTPQAQWILYGVKPVVIAVILQALWMLGKKAIKTPQAVILGCFLILLYIIGVGEILLLVIGGLIYFALDFGIKHLNKIKGIIPFTGFYPLSILGQQANEPTILNVFLSFTKIGSVLYGSGYVLLAFLRTEFVVNNPWLSDQQLIDAVAVGQLTPGPVFTTATFIGYQLGGLPMAIAATTGIFLPAFLFVALSIPIIPKIRNSPIASALLDGVNISALSLMIIVTWNLARSTLIDPLTIALAILSFVLLFRWKVNTTWLILLGAVVGLINSVVAQ